MKTIVTLFLLLMPVVGWAEGWPTVPAVKEHPPHGEWPTSIETPCHTKMQEAMRAMEKSLKEISAEDRKQPILMIPELVKPINWNHTMRECVK